MARTQLNFGVFQDALGNPLALGYLLIRLNIDAVSNDGSQVSAGRVVRVQLDANGLVDGVADFWPNDELTPSGTVYIVKAYTAQGQFVWQGEPPFGASSDLILQEDGFFITLEDGSGFIELES
jgi:hypothetical protein